MENTYSLELTESEIGMLELALSIAVKNTGTDLLSIIDKTNKISDFIKRIKI